MPRRKGSGRKPVPTQLKVLRGTTRKDRVRQHEPKPVVRIPDPPKFLDGLALEEWNRVCPILFNLGMLTDADIYSVASYCKAVEQFEECESALKKSGRLLRVNPKLDEKGNAMPNTGTLVPNPLQAMSEKARKEIRDWAAEFGFTPSARTRIDVAPPPLAANQQEKDPYEEALKKYGY